MITEYDEFVRQEIVALPARKGTLYDQLKMNGRIGEVVLVHTGIEASLLTKPLVKRTLGKEE